MGRMVCHAILLDGSECDGLASVSAARFVYKHDLTGGNDDGELSEIIYAINCPKCGQRMLRDGADVHRRPSKAIHAAREALANRVQQKESHLSRSSGRGAFFVKLSEEDG